MAPWPSLSEVQAEAMVSSAASDSQSLVWQRHPCHSDLQQERERAAITWGRRRSFCLGAPGSQSIHGVNKGEADEGGTQDVLFGGYYCNLQFFNIASLE